jgi:hypothetical protein
MRAEAVAAGEELAKLMELEVEPYLAECVYIDQADIGREFIELPAKIAYWGERYAQAVKAYLEAYAERKRVFGELMCDPLLVGDLENDLGKKPTAEQTKGRVLNEDRYKLAVMLEASTEAERERLRSMLNALSAKRDALVSLGASTRIEMQRDPLIRDPNSDD